MLALLVRSFLNGSDMKAKKLKTGRNILMPTFTRRLKSFKLKEVKIDCPHAFHMGVIGFVEQMNKLTILIDGASKEKKTPIARG